MKKQLQQQICILLACALISGTAFAGGNNKPGKRRGGGGGFSMENLSLGGGISYTRYFSEGIGSLGINLRGHYNLNEKSAVVIGFTYGLKNTLGGFTATANAMSPYTNPQTQDVPVTLGFSFHELYLQYDRFFFTESADDFGFYGFAGAGLLIVPTPSVTYGTYDTKNYSAPADPGVSSAMGPFIRFGIGMQIAAGPVHIFSDLKLDIPANSANGQQIDVTIPAGAGIVVGVKVPLAH